jgi:hypothetical protein
MHSTNIILIPCCRLHGGLLCITDTLREYEEQSASRVIYRDAHISFAAGWSIRDPAAMTYLGILADLDVSLVDFPV